MKRSLALLAGIAAACGGPRTSVTPPPRATTTAPDARPPPQPDYAGLAAQTADMLVALAEALAGSDSCAVLAEHARAVLDAHAEVRTASAQVADQGHGAQLDTALEPHAARIAAATARATPNLQRCAADPAFAAALTAFEP